MFDKNLFFSLCKKYDVELSETAVSPMLREEKELYTITEADVKRIFEPCQAYSEYSGSMT